MSGNRHALSIPYQMEQAKKVKALTAENNKLRERLRVAEMGQSFATYPPALRLALQTLRFATAENQNTQDMKYSEIIRRLSDIFGPDLIDQARCVLTSPNASHQTAGGE